MIQVVPFTLAHARALDVQDRQRSQLDCLLAHEQAHLLPEMSSYTILYHGEPIVCGGVFELSPWRGLAWSYLAKVLGHRFILAHRVAVRLCDAVPYDRIEMEVDFEFEEGHRWANMLGFELETLCVRKYRADGGDISRYVKLK